MYTHYQQRLWELKKKKEDKFSNDIKVPDVDLWAICLIWEHTLVIVHGVGVIFGGFVYKNILNTPLSFAKRKLMPPILWKCIQLLYTLFMYPFGWRSLNVTKKTKKYYPFHLFLPFLILWKNLSPCLSDR